MEEVGLGVKNLKLFILLYWENGSENLEGWV